MLGLAGAFAVLFFPLLAVAALGVFDAAPSSAGESASGGYGGGSGPTGYEPGVDGSASAQLPLTRGWHDGRALRYHDLGTHSPLVDGPRDDGRVGIAPIWLPIRGLDAAGRMIPVEGQHTILDVLPGEPGYSDLWDVVLVIVPEGYEANALTSLAAVEASGYPTMTPGMLVNCPIVPAGTTLEGGPSLAQGWHDGDAVFYPDFGPTSDAVPALYRFVRGYDEVGAPLPVGGQDAVLSAAPGDGAYSGFWRVHDVLVGEDFEAGSIRSAAEVEASGLRVIPTDLVRNAPVAASS